MSNVAPPGPEELPLPVVTFESSRVVTTVFDDILASINDGTLQPGTRLSDARLAEELGVSRTPVREAFQRLRELGIVEASANRFTRVAIVSPRQTAEAMTVWLALYASLIEEVIPDATAETADAMQLEHMAFRQAASSIDLQALAQANFAFFNLLAATSVNSALQRAINSVVHIVRLGSLHLPEYLDFSAIDSAQRTLLDAVRERDIEAARQSVRILRGVEIPQED